jgi:hypothetical protein
MLTYSQGDYEVLKGEDLGNGLNAYRSTFNEFDVLKASAGFIYECKVPSILIVTQG